MIQINDKTSIFGIIGYPLSHTLSPIIHNYLFSQLNFNGIYLVFSIKDLSIDHITSFQMLNVKGLSVTIPYKETVFHFADDTDTISTVMKSSNTLIFKDNLLQSYNTDGPGAVTAIEKFINNKEQFFENILIIGNGGSAKGIAFSLLKHSKNTKLTISARNEKSGLELTQSLNQLYPHSTKFVPLKNMMDIKNETSLVIQTTPVGMKGYENDSLIPEDFFTKNHTLFDIVYNPLKTKTVLNAEKKKTKIIPGIDMLIYQAILQFKLFTGQEEPKENLIQEVRKNLMNRLNS